MGSLKGSPPVESLTVPFGQCDCCELEFSIEDLIRMGACGESFSRCKICHNSQIMPYRVMVSLIQKIPYRPISFLAVVEEIQARNAGMIFYLPGSLAFYDTTISKLVKAADHMVRDIYSPWEPQWVDNENND